MRGGRFSGLTWLILCLTQLLWLGYIHISCSTSSRGCWGRNHFLSHFLIIKRIFQLLSGVYIGVKNASLNQAAAIFEICRGPGRRGAGQPHLNFYDSSMANRSSDNFCVNCYVLFMQEVTDEFRNIGLLQRDHGSTR